MILLIILTGLFRDFVLFATLLFVHELGHSLMGISLGWRLNKIRFFPYGGMSEFESNLNYPLWQELLVLMMGPIFQVGAYVGLSYLLGSDKMVEQLRIYHESLLIFNLLPIYPLDGGKLISLFFYYLFPFYKGMTISMTLSFFVLFLCFFFTVTYSRKVNLILILMVVLVRLIEEQKKKSYYYQKFLLERYLNEVPFRKRKIITKLKEMYRDRKHLFLIENHYQTEQTVLKKYFK